MRTPRWSLRTGVGAVVLALMGSTSYAAEPEQPPEVGCLSGLADNPDFSILKGKIQFGTAEGPTLEMMANTKRPTKAEKAAISELVSTAQACIRQGAEWRSQHWAPAINAFYEQHFVEAEALAADLYGGSITYGAYEKAIAASNAKFKTDVTEIGQKLAAERAASQQAADQQRAQQQAQERQRQQQLEIAQNQAQQQNDAARRAAIGQVFQNMQQNQYNQQLLQQQQMQQYQQIRPVNTNCQRIGNQVNCTSY